MFDIGFWELSLIGLITLLVVGPERLPTIARLAGYWIGKARRMTAAVKHEIKEELHAEELRQTLKQNASVDEISSLREEASSLVDGVKQSINDIAASQLPDERSDRMDDK